MKVNLFDIDPVSKRAKITKHVHNIWYLREILDEYGEQNALKIFQIMDGCYNLNSEENPFATLDEEVKFETVLRSTYPELASMVNFDDQIIISAFELVGELYETANYKAYKSLKIVHEKIVKQMRYAHISLDKIDGNMAEIKKAMEGFEDLRKKLSESYEELEKENDIGKFRGGRKGSYNASKELD